MKTIPVLFLLFALFCLSLPATESPSGLPDNPDIDELFRQGLELFEGGDADRLSAILAWEAAARGGHLKAIYNLGIVYRDGLGTPSDLPRAVSLFDQAARLGDAEAMYELALLLGNRDSGEADSLQSFGWYKASAQAGNPKAQYKLGTMYEDGHTVPPDIQSAMSWYLKAAGQGVVEAQYRLGTWHMDQDAAPDNLIQAYVWLWVAAVNARNLPQLRYQEALQACEARMDARQSEQAKALIEAVMDCYERNRR